jgi:hypothetical protein
MAADPPLCLTSRLTKRPSWQEQTAGELKALGTKGSPELSHLPGAPADCR